MSRSFTESVVEDASLACLESLGWQVEHGQEIARDELRVKNAEQLIERVV